MCVYILYIILYIIYICYVLYMYVSRNLTDSVLATSILFDHQLMTSNLIIVPGSYIQVMLSFKVSKYIGKFFFFHFHIKV